jgi:Protein of unknown function (DUF1194)
VPWRLIDGPESAEAVTNDEIKGAPYRRAPRTSIFGALQFAKPLFDSSGYGGLRRVIDVSGDGSNNMGPPVTIMRDEVLAAGITINGLPIMLSWAYATGPSVPNLDVYYEDCVIGGLRRNWIVVGFIADLSRHDLPAQADSGIVRGRSPLP